MVEFYDPVSKKNLQYHIDAKLKSFLERTIKGQLQKKDKDYLMVVDGKEGAGKSTMAMQIGKYVDPTLDLDRICMNATEFTNAINSAKKNQCVIFDEACSGLLSADSISKVGKLLRSLMMQMRQKNLFVIICIPSIFELNKYTALHRAKFLIHVYEIRGQRTYWVGYNSRDLRRIYLTGKKTYSYKIWSSVRGRFYGKDVIDREGYDKKKIDALKKEDKVDEAKNISRNKMMWLIHKELKASALTIAKLFKKWDINLKQSAIQTVLSNLKEIYELRALKDGK